MRGRFDSLSAVSRAKVGERHLDARLTHHIAMRRPQAPQLSVARPGKRVGQVSHRRFLVGLSCWSLVYRATRRPQPPQLSGAKAGTGGSVGVLRMTMFPRELS